LLDDTSQPSKQPAKAEEKLPVSETNEMRGFKSSGFKSSFKPAAPVAPTLSEGTAIDDGDIDGQSMEMDTEDIEGEALDHDVDGEEMEDLDGEALDGVDGAPMEEEDMDGEPL
jgi:U2-associated protein SR140